MLGTHYGASPPSYKRPGSQGQVLNILHCLLPPLPGPEILLGALLTMGEEPEMCCWQALKMPAACSLISTPLPSIPAFFLSSATFPRKVHPLPLFCFPGLSSVMLQLRARVLVRKASPSQPFAFLPSHRLSGQDSMNSFFRRTYNG